MSITDELREYAQSWRETPNLMDELDAGDIDGLLGDIERIADRIDQAHESAMYDMRREHDEWVADRDAKWVTLPLDADGEAIHVGDVVDADMETFKIEQMLLTRWGWAIDSGKYTQLEMRHHHEPTVEDVLRELLDAWDGRGDTGGIDLSEFASRLRLAGSDAE